MTIPPLTTPAIYTSGMLNLGQYKALAIGSLAMSEVRLLPEDSRRRTLTAGLESMTKSMSAKSGPTNFTTWRGNTAARMSTTTAIAGKTIGVTALGVINAAGGRILYFIVLDETIAEASTKLEELLLSVQVING
jgi:hypothetical protein